MVQVPGAIENVSELNVDERIIEVSAPQINTFRDVLSPRTTTNNFFGDSPSEAPQEEQYALYRSLQEVLNGYSANVNDEAIRSTRDLIGKLLILREQ